MPDFLITYDVADSQPDPHKPLLAAAEKEGLLYVWAGKSYVSRLPNTTLWGVSDTIADADAAFQRVLITAGKTIGLKITLENRRQRPWATALSFPISGRRPSPNGLGSAIMRHRACINGTIQSSDDQLF